MAQRNEKTCKLAVIGGGPGGYVAAIRAAQLGMETVLVEKGHLGGVCGNVGCIPTKALIHAARMYLRTQNAADVGVMTENLSLDFSRTAAHRDRVVKLLRNGVERLLDGNDVDLIRGEAHFEDPHTLKVSGDEETLIRADNVIIATGSKPFALPGIEFDDEKIIDSSVAVNLDELPESLLIVGGGYIGCEFAAAFSAMEVDVTVVEMMERILPQMDADCGREVYKQLKKQGADILTDTKVDALEKDENGVRATLSDGEEISCEKALISVGRQPNTDGLMLNNAGIETGDNGQIEVNEHLQTDVPHIYAVGDVNGKNMLAHVASQEGTVAAAHLGGTISAMMDYSVVPAIAFTYPELGTVGLSEETAAEQYEETIVKRYPMRALGKAQVSAETEGFVKMVADANTGQILGVHIVSPEASNLIAEGALGLQLEVTAEEIAETIHAHPTMPESLRETAEGIIGMPVNWLG